MKTTVTYVVIKVNIEYDESQFPETPDSNTLVADFVVQEMDYSLSMRHANAKSAKYARITKTEIMGCQSTNPV